MLSLQEEYYSILITRACERPLLSRAALKTQAPLTQHSTANHKTACFSKLNLLSELEFIIYMHIILLKDMYLINHEKMNNVWDAPFST